MRIPAHIGIIPDGNRRWALNNGHEKHEGYTYGLNPGLEVLKLAKEYGIKEITYYGFTVDNCKRPAVQIDAFQTACVDAIKLIANEGASLLVVGNTESRFFPKELIPFTERTDICGGGIKTNFLVNYGWEWDLSSLKDGSDVAASLRSKDISRIDLILRWGGMRRLSGFLPVQSVYADFYVVDAMWPDFKREHFDSAMLWYNKQDVTRGG